MYHMDSYNDTGNCYKCPSCGRSFDIPWVILEDHLTWRRSIVNRSGFDSVPGVLLHSHVV